MSIVNWEPTTRALHGDIVLNGETIDVAVGGMLQGFEESLEVDGSPIIRLSLLDPERQLVRSGLLDLEPDDEDALKREVELVVDGVGYWLRQVNQPVEGDTLELTFEDREVARMRGRRGALKVSPRTLDDRGFIKRLCSVAGMPELITDSPGDREKAARERAGIGKTKIRLDDDNRRRRRRREPGLPAVRLTVKGATADAAQRKNGALILSACHEDGAGPKATIAAVAAGIIENELRNSNVINDPGSTSVGVFQAQFGLSEGLNDRVITREEALDVEYMTRCFLEDRAGGGFASKGGARYLERTQPSLTPGEIAAIVEAPAAQYRGRYAEVEGEARQWVQAFTGGDLPLSSGLSGTASTTREAALVVERGESYWDAARRTAESYGARFFVVANQPYYLRDENLMAAEPAMTLADPKHPEADVERSTGVRGIGWEWAPHGSLRTTALRIDATIHQLQPGDVVLLDETCGPAGVDPSGGRDSQRRGRWLVGSYQRSRFETTADVTLIKGRKPLVPTVIDTENFTIPGASRDGSVRVGRGGTTSPFGGAKTYPISGAYGTDRGDHIHAGLDVGVPYGTPCIAPFDGEITMATTSGFGTAGGMLHLRALAAVPGTSIRAGDKIGWGHVSAVQARVGQKVSAGTRVGTSGGSPAHVHFVLLRSGGGGNGVDGNADPTADLRALGGIP